MSLKKIFMAYLGKYFFEEHFKIKEHLKDGTLVMERFYQHFRLDCTSKITL